MTEKEKVRCVHCGHKQNIFYDKNALCKGIYIRCKARQCRKIFEVKINQDK